MPITLKYGNPAGVLTAAYAAGKNKAQQREREQAQKIVQQQQSLKYDASRQQFRFQHLEQMQQNTFGQQAVMQDARAEDWDELQEGRFEQQSRLQGSLFGQQRQLLDERSQSALDLDQAEGVRRGQLQYTPAQQSQINQIDADMADIERSNQLDDGQKREALGKSLTRRRSIIPQPRPEEQSVPIGEQYASDIHWDERGTPWVRDKDGQLQVPRGWKAPESSETKDRDYQDSRRKLEFEQRLKLTEKMQTRRDALKGLMDKDDKTPRYKPEAIDKMIKDEFGSLETLIGGQNVQPESNASRAIADPMQSQAVPMTAERRKLQAEGVITQAVENQELLKDPDFREKYHQARQIYGTGK